MTKKRSKPDDVIDAEFEPVEEPGLPDPDQKPPRKRAAWPLVWVLFLVAILISVLASSLITRLTLKPIAPVAGVSISDFEALQTQLDQLKAASTEGLKRENKIRIAQISSLKNQISELGSPTEQTNLNWDEIQTRLTQIQSRLDALEARPLPIVDNETTIGEGVSLAPLLARIDALETAPASAPDLTDYARLSDLPDDISDLVQILDERVQVLEEAQVQGVGADKIETLSRRLGALEAQDHTTSSRAGQAMALADLKLAVQGSNPFLAAYTSAQVHFSSNTELQKLANIAIRGAPTRSELSDDLNGLIPALYQAANKPAEDASLATKAGAALRALVSVRRIDGKGDGMEASLALAQSAMQSGDLGSAISIMSRIKTTTPASAAWIKNAKNRQLIEQVLEALVSGQATGDAP